MAKDSKSTSVRVFSTISGREFPDLLRDLQDRPGEAHGKRMAYLANLGLFVDRALAQNPSAVLKLVSKKGLEAATETPEKPDQIPMWTSEKPAESKPTPLAQRRRSVRGFSID